MPDHQEVFLDRDGLTSIVFDITERVVDAADPTSDTAALRFHLSDLIDSSTTTSAPPASAPSHESTEAGHEELKIWSERATTFSKLPFVDSLLCSPHLRYFLLPLLHPE